MSRQYVYSNAEYLSMVQLYAVANYNLEEARRLYAKPEHLDSLREKGIENPQVPSTITILSTTQRLLEYGQFRVPVSEHRRGRPSYPPELQKEILEYFEKDPRRSTRMAAATFSVSQRFVWTVLKKHGYELNGTPSERVRALNKSKQPQKQSHSEEHPLSGDD